jgi:hypothetical protein
VPRAYLARFGHNGRVLVRWRDKPGLVPVGVQNVAVECGFYEIEGPTGVRSVAVEEALAGLEGAAAEAIQLIDRTEAPPDVGTPERTTLAAFMALQLTRTPEQRGRVFFAMDLAAYAGARKLDRIVVAEYLERVHLGFRPRDAEVSAALDLAQVVLRDPVLLTSEFAIRLMLESVDQLAPVLLDRHWTLEIARKPRLLTSDHPLVIWRTPSPRDRYEGVGIANAEQVRFPLDPGKQLVLTLTQGPPVRAIEPTASGPAMRTSPAPAIASSWATPTGRGRYRRSRSRQSARFSGSTPARFTRSSQTAASFTVAKCFTPGFRAADWAMVTANATEPGGPIGYRAEAGQLVADPSEQRILQRVRELADSGASLRTIAATLTTGSYPTRRGGRWQPTQIARILQHG